MRVAGGLKRSAFADSADLTRFAASSGPNSERVEVKLAAALSGDANEDVPLRNGDVLAIRQIPQWNDLGASVTVSGEVQHPATYGIEPGERLSSVLMRCNGFTPEAYPYGAVLIRPGSPRNRNAIASGVAEPNQGRRSVLEDFAGR